MRPAPAVPEGGWALSPSALEPLLQVGRWAGAQGRVVSSTESSVGKSKSDVSLWVRRPLGRAITLGRRCQPGSPSLLENKRNRLPEDRQGFQPLQMQPPFPGHLPTSR